MIEKPSKGVVFPKSEAGSGKLEVFERFAHLPASQSRYIRELFGFGKGSCCPIDCRRVFGCTRGRSLAMVDQSSEPFTKVIYILGAPPHAAAD